jgi:histidinol-phosphate/aromatic aminotransferase/cobyric acid decarboxylase-like protein
MSVTRSFSKGYGLAGLRFGYALAIRRIAQMARSDTRFTT